MQQDNVFNHGQAQAGALPAGSEIRIKNPGQDVRRDPGAVVAKLKQDLVVFYFKADLYMPVCLGMDAPDRSWFRPTVIPFSPAKQI